MKKFLVTLLAVSSMSSFAQSVSECQFDVKVDVLTSNAKFQEYIAPRTYAISFSNDSKEVEQAKADLAALHKKINAVTKTVCNE